MLQIIQTQFHVGRIAKIPNGPIEQELARGGLLMLHPLISPPSEIPCIQRSTVILYGRYFEQVFFQLEDVVDNLEINLPLEEAEPRANQDSTYCHFIICAIDRASIDASTCEMA